MVGSVESESAKNIIAFQYLHTFHWVSTGKVYGIQICVKQPLTHLFWPINVLTSSGISVFATIDTKIEFRILEQQSLPKSLSQLKQVHLLISLHTHTPPILSYLKKPGKRHKPSNKPQNKHTLHNIHEQKEGMFSTYVTVSLHATSYLRGRLLVHSEIGESRPKSVTTQKAHAHAC